MLETVGALFLRIISNPCANVFQKKLSQNHSVLLINLYTYLFLSLFCIIPFFSYDWWVYGADYWFYVTAAGILCVLGSVFIMKALQIGELSILAPINSYKCIAGLLLGIVFLGEIPGVSDISGMILIIWGSKYILGTLPEGFSLKLLKRKDILYRILALVFSGSEAVILKKIITMSGAVQSFIWWCFTGFIFSAAAVLILKPSIKIFSLKDTLKCVITALFLGLMQISTNFVFKNMDVGIALALFQLSNLVSVFLGFKIFKETQIIKKITGSIIMILGTALIFIGF